MTRSQGIRRTWVFAAVMALFVSVTSSLAWATHEDDPDPGPPIGATGSDFEILDGNTVRDGVVDDHFDWDDPQGTVTVKDDADSGAGDNSFTQGTKEDTAVPVVETGSIPPNKSDLKEFGFTVESNDDGDFLHLFWTRVQDPSGTTNMDFEFNAKACIAGGNTSGCSTNGVTPERTTGDLLITYDLSRGGTRASIALRTWTGSAWGPAEDLDADVATGSINQTAITTDINGEDGSYSARTFGEATVNLAEVLDPTKCSSFGGAYLKSRSSDSFTSALKDFIAPVGTNISNCGRLVVNKTAGGQLLGGAGFTISPANAATTPVSTMTSVATGVFCIDSLLIGTEYTVTESTVPSGYDGAAPQKFTPTSVGTCSGVSATSTPDLTFVNTPKTGSLRVRKVVGTSTTLLDGAQFTAALLPSGSAVSMTERSTGIFCLDGLAPGTYRVVESVVPPGYNGAASQDIAVTADNSTCSKTTFDATFSNNAAPGRIDITKVDDATPPNPVPGAKFKLFTDNAPLGTYEAATDVPMIGTEQETSATGAASFTNVPAGTNYCVVESFTPAGYTTAAPQCGTVGLGTTAGTGVTITLTFVNVRTHRVIVLVCHEASNTLVASNVTINGTTKASLATGTPAEQAALCAIGGATFGGLSHAPPNTSASIAIAH